jgi:hypothetical protein
MQGPDPLKGPDFFFSHSTHTVSNMAAFIGWAGVLLAASRQGNF